MGVFSGGWVSIEGDRLEECQKSDTRKVSKMVALHLVTQKYFVILRLFVQKVSLLSLPFIKGGFKMPLS